jgi:hypothetical protein
MKRLVAALIVSLCCLLLAPTLASASTPTLRQLARTVATLQKKVNAQAAKITAQNVKITSQGAAITSLSTELASAKSAITVLQQAPVAGVSQAQFDALAAKVTSDESTLAAQGTILTNAASLLAIAPYVSLNTGAMNGVKGPNVVFQGCNLHLRDGSGATNCNPGNVNTLGAQTGLGNLIIGYDEIYSGARTGSNNLVVGIYNSFPGAGCFVDGRANTVSAQYSAVSGGAGNTASAEAAAVSGGISNQATAAWSAVSGGIYNVASNYEASVSGGWNNSATGQYSSISGGYNNTASGSCASITGGSGGSVATQYGRTAGGAFHNP